MEAAQTQKEQMEVAQMRFGVIAPLVQGTYTDASMAAYCRRVALTPQRLPDGRVFQYKPKTVEKWYQLYEKGGMEALIPRTRCDKGGTRVISDEAEREIHRLRKEYPRLNATKVCEKLVQDGTLPATVSVSTVQRYIKHNGLRGIQDALYVRLCTWCRLTMIILKNRMPIYTGAGKSMCRSRNYT